MNSSTVYLETLQKITEVIEQKLLKLEADKKKEEELFKRLLEDSAELVEAGRGGPAYIEERTLRLQNLIQRLHGESGYSSSRFTPLYRQLERINNQAAGELFSPLMEKNLRRTTRGHYAREHLERVTGPDSTLIYMLGDIRFAVRGRVLRHIRDQKPVREVIFRDRRVDCFPYREDRVFFPVGRRAFDLLIIKKEIRTGGNEKPSEYLGLWCDRPLSINKSLSHLTPGAGGALEELGSPHRYISGRFKRQGKWIYLIGE